MEKESLVKKVTRQLWTAIIILDSFDSYGDFCLFTGDGIYSEPHILWITSSWRTSFSQSNNSSSVYIVLIQVKHFGTKDIFSISTLLPPHWHLYTMQLSNRMLILVHLNILRSISHVSTRTSDKWIFSLLNNSSL